MIKMDTIVHRLTKSDVTWTAAKGMTFRVGCMCGRFFCLTCGKEHETLNAAFECCKEAE